MEAFAIRSGSGAGPRGGLRLTASHMEMDESLVGSPGFKPVREALTLSWVGSIPTHLRQASPQSTAAKGASRRSAHAAKPVHPQVKLRSASGRFALGEAWRISQAAGLDPTERIVGDSLVADFEVDVIGLVHRLIGGTA